MSDNSIWVDLIAYLGWSFAVAAFFFSTVAGATSRLAKTHRDTLSLWLMGALDDITWTEQFCIFFNYLFGKRHFSLQCILASCLASAIAVLMIWLLLGPILGVLETRTATDISWWMVLLFGAIINFLPDYLSLLQTRLVLQSFQKIQSVIGQLGVLILDTLMTGAIIWLGVHLFVLLFGDPITGADQIAGAEMVVIVSPYSIFFYSTFLTSALAWIYWFTTALLKIFTHLGLNRILDIEDNPGLSLATVGALLIFVVCFGFDRLISVRDGKIIANETLCGWFLDLCDDFARLSDDEEEQLRYLTLACKGGVTLQCLIGAEESLSIDNAAAARLWRIACTDAPPSGCSNLGVLHQTGLGVSQNFTVAAEYFERACVARDPTGCVNLGFLFDNGRGVPRDSVRAANLFKDSCNDGEAGGCFNFGILTEAGRGTPEDPIRAAELYEQGCEGGERRSCTNLGMLLDAGRGVPEEPSRAADYFERGCNGGDARGCTILGIFYTFGRAVPVDHTRANELYTQGCEGGDFRSCANLGYSYFSGTGVPKNLSRAVELYRLACNGGDERSCTALRELGVIE